MRITEDEARLVIARRTAGRKVIHLPLSGSYRTNSTDVYKQTVTLCKPNGQLTNAGWDRSYNVTDNASAATCANCLSRDSK